jgi:hypothetical protein
MANPLRGLETQRPAERNLFPARRSPQILANPATTQTQGVAALRIWFARLFWLFAIFSLVWLVVFVYWQSTARLPSESDVALYLGVLPLGLAALGWGAYKLITRSAAPQAALSKPSGAAMLDTTKQAAEQEREWTLLIAATSLQTSAGLTAAEVLGKLKEGAVEPELDPELKSPEGFAVFSARIPDLDDADTREALAEWQKTSTQPELAWSDSQYRSLHLAGASMGELAAQAVLHPEVLLYWKLKEEGRLKSEDSVTPLRLVALWPKHWSDVHQTMASAWLKSLLVQHGWPGHRVVMQEYGPEQSHPIAVLDYINVSARRAQLPTIGILIACDSAIEQAHVDALASGNNLFTGKNTQGAKPGEVAAGLLFADDQQSRLLGQESLSRLHRASWASREKSADEKGRISADLLGRLTDLALETAKLEASKIRLVSADNDHKPSRESELAEMFTAKLPDLDPTKDAVKVAQACGSMNHMTMAAALCVAHQFVVDEQAPALCMSLHDPLLRAAVVLSAAPPASNPSRHGEVNAA